jgi:hypothetical protein
MALISCYECGKQISDQAKACPNCGAPVKAPEKKKFCKYCGTQITESVTFCPACGKSQTANAVPQEQSQQPVQPASYRPQQFAAMGMQQPFFMPCAAHPQSPAVASCGSCGKSICNECADKSEYRIDNVPLCRECNLQLMNANIAESESTRNWSVVKLIFLLVCVLIGLAAWSGDTGNGNGHIWGWIIAGLGGLPSAMKTAFHRSESEKAVADAHIRVDAENGCIYEVMWFIVALVFSFALAPVAAIWYIIKNTLKIISNNNFLKKERPLRDNLILELQGA